MGGFERLSSLPHSGVRRPYGEGRSGLIEERIVERGLVGRVARGRHQEVQRRDAAQKDGRLHHIVR